MGQHRKNEGGTKGTQSLYGLKHEMGNGDMVDFAQYKGKKIVIVNTASNCGYTQQYQSLQKLYSLHKDKLVVLGFPSNDFKNQEQGSDQDIHQFCELNFGVSFPLMKKSMVLKGLNQNPVFHWLSDPALNGWNDRAPIWNFTKYLINEEGQLMHVFGPSIDPEDEVFVRELMDNG